MRETTVVGIPRTDATEGSKMKTKYWIAYRKFLKVNGRIYPARIEVEVRDCQDRADAMEAAAMCVCEGAVMEGWD